MRILWHPILIDTCIYSLYIARYSGTIHYLLEFCLFGAKKSIIFKLIDDFEQDFTFTD